MINKVKAAEYIYMSFRYCHSFVNDLIDSYSLCALLAMFYTKRQHYSDV